MKLNKPLAMAVMLVGLLVGGLGAGLFLQRPAIPASAAPAAQQTACPDENDAQHEAEGDNENSDEGVDCEENEVDEVNEVDDEAEDGDETDAQDQAETPAYSGSITVDQNQFLGMSEADEAQALQSVVQITADEAKVAAEAVNSGATATGVELENEDGVLVYSVSLDNGLEVKVDAGNSSILQTEAADDDDQLTN